MRNKQSLDGWWDYRIGKGAVRKIRVPSSPLCVGESEYRLQFDVDSGAWRPGRRAFLVFEGITYLADVTLNDVALGELSPYIEHRLEITPLLRETGNDLRVAIRDLRLPFGPSAGWENYSGLIRSVWIEYTDASLISDVVWSTSFEEGYKSAECVVEIETDAREDGTRLRATLTDASGALVGSGESDAPGRIAFRVDRPSLWSPDRPTLYTLECALLSSDGARLDVVTQRVGMKDLAIKGRRFYLNGEQFFLWGVDRHDIYGECGHTLTEEQMRRDMLMIKRTGANFVRLVHYPHNKRIVELADEIGLLVSEEPGLWWSDVRNEKTCEGALKTLEGVIRRDRNHVSIAFWLSFNECRFTPEFLEATARLARRVDPHHLVSGANCMDLEDTKEQFTRCGFDFYTMHPYAATTGRLEESAAYLSEMPLVLTEWGGHHCDRNERLFRTFIRKIVELSRNPEDQPTLAGAVFWEWAETYDFNRGAPGCTDGVLHEGLVDMFRNPTPNLRVFVEEFARLSLPDCAERGRLDVVMPWTESGSFRPLSIEENDDRETGWETMLAHARSRVPDYGEQRYERRITVGPTLPEKLPFIGTLPVELSQRPYVITERPLTVSACGFAERFYVIGGVSMPGGFPIGGPYGEPVAECVVEYEDGGCETFVIENGTHLTTATRLHGSSRINPVAAESPRVIEFSYDRDWEQYAVNLITIPADPTRAARRLRFRRVCDRYDPLLYGVTQKDAR